MGGISRGGTELFNGERAMPAELRQDKRLGNRCQIAQHFRGVFVGRYRKDRRALRYLANKLPDAGRIVRDIDDDRG